MTGGPTRDNRHDLCNDGCALGMCRGPLSEGCGGCCRCLGCCLMEVT